MSPGTTEHIDLAVIGGSGLYELSGLERISERQIDTPFGEPSGPVLLGQLGGKRLAFLARHGAGHRLNPSQVPYRANIFALKSLGAARVLSVSACGSLREEFAPGHVVIPNQLFDRTVSRPRSFFDEGIVVHLGAADPFCPETSASLLEATRAAGGTVHAGGALITIEGPRFSTRAESGVYRSWGMSLIGMTTTPEAFLAREAELCYAVMAHVTDYDVWHETAGPVSVEVVLQTLHRNTTLAQNTIVELVKRLPPTRSCECSNALAGAIISAPEAISSQVRSKLGPLIEQYVSS